MLRRWTWLLTTLLVACGEQAESVDEPVDELDQAVTRNAVSALPGDCNNDGMVDRAELAIGERQKISPATITQCRAFDRNFDNRVTKEELDAAKTIACNDACVPSTVRWSYPQSGQSYDLGGRYLFRTASAEPTKFYVTYNDAITLAERRVVVDTVDGELEISARKNSTIWKGITSGKFWVSAQRSGERSWSPLDMSIIYNRSPQQSKLIAVLALKYIPTTVSGGLDYATLNMDPASYGSGSDAVARYTKALDQSLAAQLTARRTASTYFHDGKAIPYLNYQVATSKTFKKPVPIRSDVTQANHQKMFVKGTDVDVCYYVDTVGVREVWVAMYHNDRVAPIESNMEMGTRIQKYWNRPAHGGLANGYSGDLPTCKNTYTVYEFNTSFQSSNLHNLGHHLESVLGYMDYDLFNRFAGVHAYVLRLDGNEDEQAEDRPLLDDFGRTHCGNAHFAANTNRASGHYNYAEPVSAESACDDWRPDGSGKLTPVSCDTIWGCGHTSEDNWQIYWMQRMPGRANNLTHRGQTVRNFWEYIADFDGTMIATEGGSLVYETGLAAPEDFSLLVDATLLRAHPGQHLSVFLDAEVRSGTLEPRPIAFHVGDDLLAGVGRFTPDYCIRSFSCTGTLEVDLPAMLPTGVYPLTVEARSVTAVRTRGFHLMVTPE